MRLKKKKKKKKFFFLFIFFLFFFWKKSLESAPKFSGRSGNRKHNYFFFWPYSIPMVWRPSSVHRRPSTMLKDLLLRNRWADQSQILCGASLGRGNDILFAAMVKTLQKSSSPEPAGRFSRNFVCSIGDSSPS